MAFNARQAASNLYPLIYYLKTEGRPSRQHQITVRDCRRGCTGSGNEQQATKHADRRHAGITLHDAFNGLMTRWPDDEGTEISRTMPLPREYILHRRCMHERA